MGRSSTKEDSITETILPMGRSSTKEDSITETILPTAGSQHVDDHKPLEVIHIRDAVEPCTIYRVPTNMFKAHETAFIPKAISIGPFHYRNRNRNESFRVMEEHKMRLVNRMLEEAIHGIWGGDHPTHSTLEDDLSLAMKNMEDSTRESYSKSFQLESKDFVQMMVFDGCFVVGLLRLYHKSKKEHVDDPIFTTSWILPTLQRDLIMLENQLPYFVLEKIFELTCTDKKETPLKHLIVMFFDPLFSRKLPITKLTTDKKDCHMLNIFRSTFLVAARKKFNFTRQQHNSSSSLVEDRQLVRSATEMEESGIKFRGHKGDDMLDIEYHDRTLKMASLSLDDNAVLMFLNFLAYEQCHQLSTPYFTNFFVFLDGMVNEARDIEILHKHGILNHTLGSDELAAALIAQICREMDYDSKQFYLAPDAQKINHHCTVYYDSEWQRWWRNLIRTYFSSPWTFLSLVAAILLLVLTFLSTFYAILTYYRP